MVERTRINQWIITYKKTNRWWKRILLERNFGWWIPQHGQTRCIHDHMHLTKANEGKQSKEEVTRKLNVCVYLDGNSWKRVGVGKWPEEDFLWVSKLYITQNKLCKVTQINYAKYIIIHNFINVGLTFSQHIN